MSRSSRIATRPLLAAALAAALVLAGCSNSDDPGASSSGPTDSVVSSGLGGSPMAGSGAPSADGSSGSSGSASPSGAPKPTPTSMHTTSVAPSSRPPKPTPSSPKPSGRGAVGAFTAAETEWFDALCTGLDDKPSDQFAQLSGDLEAKRLAAADLLKNQVARLDKAVATMKRVGAPGIEHGTQLDRAVRAAFLQVAAAGSAGAASVAEAGTEKELAERFGRATDAMNKAADPLNAFGEDMSAPALLVQLRKIPSCRQLVGP